MKKTVIYQLLIFGLLAILLGVSCQQQKEPIKVGLAVNLSGPGGAPGEHIRDGALQAVADINAQGGVCGRPLQLLVRDDKNSIEGIRLADADLIRAGVPVIIGHSQSANTLQAYDLVTASKTLLLTAYTAADALSGKDDLFLRTAVDCRLYGLKTAALLLKKGFNRVVFLVDLSNADFGNDYVFQTRTHFPGAVSVVRFDPRVAPDWHGIIAELLAPEPDAVVLLTSSPSSAVAAQFLHQQKPALPLIASPWAQSPELIAVGGKAVEGMTIITFSPSENQRPDYVAFSHRLEKNFGKKVTPRSARAQELMFILADALGRCKTINGPKLKDALLAGSYETILGQLKFDRFGDVIRPLYEEQVVNGSFKTLGVIE